MSFSAHSRTAFGSFLLGAAINLFIVIALFIIHQLTDVQFFWFQLPLVIMVGLMVYLSGTKIWHPIWFWFGLIFGFIGTLALLLLLAFLGILTVCFIFGAC